MPKFTRQHIETVRTCARATVVRAAQFTGIDDGASIDWIVKDLIEMNPEDAAEKAQVLDLAAQRADALANWMERDLDRLDIDSDGARCEVVELLNALSRKLSDYDYYELMLAVVDECQARADKLREQLTPEWIEKIKADRARARRQAGN